MIWRRAVWLVFRHEGAGPDGEVEGEAGGSGPGRCPDSGVC